MAAQELSLIVSNKAARQPAKKPDQDQNLRGGLLREYGKLLENRLNIGITSFVSGCGALPLFPSEEKLIRGGVEVNPCGEGPHALYSCSWSTTFPKTS